MDTKALTNSVSQNDWARLAQLANVSVEELQKRYVEALEEFPAMLREISVSVANAAVDGDCTTRSFEISFLKILGIRGTIKLCTTGGGNWTADVEVCLLVLGESVWCTSFALSSQNAGICFNVDLFLVKGELCFGIVGQRLCFNIKGRLCVWSITGWQCESFNETPFCIIPG